MHSSVRLVFGLVFVGVLVTLVLVVVKHRAAVPVPVPAVSAVGGGCEDLLARMAPDSPIRAEVR